MKNPLAFLFSREETDTHVNNREILYYATGLAGQNIAYAYISGRLTYFYENHAVSSGKAHIVGKMMSLSHIWDAINDIIVGAYVDRAPHKPLQKMRPYLLYLPLIIGITGAMMFLRVGSGDTFRLIWLAALYIVWDLVYSFQDVGLWGLLALSSPHSRERSRIAQWVSIGAGAGSTVANAFPFLWDVLKKFMPEHAIFTLFGFLFGLGGEVLSLRAAKFRERVDSPVQTEEKPWESLAVIRHNPTLILISLARLSQGLSPQINGTYFFQSEFRNGSGILKGGTAEMVYGIISGAPGAVAMPFANKIIGFLGGMKSLLLVSQITAIGMRLIVFGVGSTKALRYNTLPGFFVMSLLCAVYNVPGALMDIAHRSLTSDSIDEVELKTGIRTEGVSFSMQNFTSKLTSGVRTFIQNFFLFRVLGYQALEEENYIAMQGEKFYRWQFPMFMLGPIVGSALYLLCISFVKDSKAHRDEVERLLKERRAQKAAEAADAAVNDK